jgi:pyruvate dehydrogenase E2 component (dihydrolipoamide acetyltransferase)
MNRDVLLPDIGDFKAVDVIEVLVKPGDVVKKEAPLIVLESDKATMEIPAPYSGTVIEVKVKVGDKVSEGAPIATMDSRADVGTPPQPADRTEERPDAIPATVQSPAENPPVARPAPALPQTAETVRGSRSARAHASPSVRRFARELGVDLGLVPGSGPKGRILQGDVKAFTRETLSGMRASGRAVDQVDVPPIDFSKFGKTELRPLSKIKRLTGQSLHRSWIAIPLVTQFDETDVTDLEVFRKSQLASASAKDIKLTLVTFLCKAVVVALRKFPEFNASLTSDGESLVLKKYFHLGVAVNTDQGLLVPVVRDVDQKGLFDIASEIQTLSEKARAGKLEPKEMQGGCFTISSLGSIGGTGFTPIVNAPEVAILGVSRARMQPVWTNDQFAPRLMLPFALSYDHRVIDGVAAVSFTRFLSDVLSDIRQILL